VRGGEKNLPGRILGARPKRTWIRRLPRLGQAVLVRLRRPVEHARPAPQSRGQWTWVGDDRGFTKARQHWGLVGRW
jgi:hypothetical protein